MTNFTITLALSPEFKSALDNLSSAIASSGPSPTEEMPASDKISEGPGHTEEMSDADKKKAIAAEKRKAKAAEKKAAEAEKAAAEKKAAEEAAEKAAAEAEDDDFDGDGEPTHTKEEILGKLKEVSKVHGKPVAVKILKTVGECSGLTDIQPSTYDAVFAALTKKLEED